MPGIFKRFSSASVPYSVDSNHTHRDGTSGFTWIAEYAVEPPDATFQSGGWLGADPGCDPVIERPGVGIITGSLPCAPITTAAWRYFASVSILADDATVYRFFSLNGSSFEVRFEDPLTGLLKDPPFFRLKLEFW